MLDAILLLGLLALFLSHRALSTRVVALEREVEFLAGSSITSQAATLEPPAEPVSFLEAPGVKVPTTTVPNAEPQSSIVESDPAPEPAPAETIGGWFERIVGGRLLIWTGGIAVALAGLFLVRYSIELGLIGPATRMVMAGVFGLILLAAGEWARRRVPDDPRIGQALVGAGVLVLYAAAYGSHILYGLIGLGTAFALMAAVATVALVLSLRHGTPAAVLGLVGGYATPLLVGDPRAGAVSLLGYLALLGIAVFAVAILSRRHWLAWGARWLTLGWTASLLFTANEPLAVGLFLLAATTASALALGDDDEPAPWIAPYAAASQLGAVVAIDLGPRSWALFGALAAAGFLLGPRNRSLARLPGIAVPSGLALLAWHCMANGPHAAAVAAGMTLLFAGGAWLRMGTGAAHGQAWQWTWIFCAGAAGPASIVRILEAPMLPRPFWGLLFAVLTILPVGLAWRLRGRARLDAPFDQALLLAATTGAGLLGAAAFDLVGNLWLPLAWMAVAGVALIAARRLGDGGIVQLSLSLAGLAALAAAARAAGLWETLAFAVAGRPAFVTFMPTPGEALLLFAAPSLLLFAMWQRWPVGEPGSKRAAGWLAAGLGAVAAYVVYKHGFALRTPAAFAARGFAERTVLTQALFLAGWLAAVRGRSAWLRHVGSALTVVAVARFLWFDLLVLNPVLVTQNVGDLPVFNLLAPAYLGSAAWLWLARRKAAVEGAGYASIPFGLFLAALIAGAGLLVRQAFAGAVLTGPVLGRPEFYGYSLAGLAVSIGLLVWGWRRGDTPLRVAGLALLAATVVKVFGIDAARLEGVLRILSFLGLGIALIGMGKLYGTLLGRRAPS